MGNGRLALLRYRFDNTAQLSRHLHPAEGAALLFLRDVADQVVEGSRVLLDVEVREGRHNAVIRGEVVARTQRGAWLSTQAAATLARELEDRVIFGRREKRLSAEHLVQITRGGNQSVAQILDISPGGARLRGVRGFAPGEPLSLELFGVKRSDSVLGDATVVRVEGIEAGIAFKGKRIELVRLIRGLQDAWANARRIEHLKECCSGGRLLDPPPPRLTSI